MIKVLTGAMFSGKSSGLTRIYDTMWNKEIICCFKPKLDTRDGDKIKARHSTNSLQAISINNIKEIENYINKNTKVIFIDEAQFLKGDISLIKKLSMLKDIDFYIAGLNMTSELEPFGIMPNIMAVADEIEYYHASCYYCNKRANYTMYKGENKEKVLVGSDMYVPTCAKCYVEHKLLSKNRTKK